MPTTLTLDRVWINRLSDGAAVAAFSAGRARSHAVAGEVRTYANGRRRAITRAGEAGKFSCTLVEVPEATMETLRTWMGVDVALRDNRGQRFLGTFFAVAVAETKDLLTTYSVAIDLETVDVVEEV